MAEILERNKIIKSFEIIEFPNSPILQNRFEFDDNEKKQFMNALELREKYFLSFWDALILTFFSNETYSQRLLENVKMHNELIKILNFNSKELKHAISLINSDNGKNYALTSRVVNIHNEVLHIPMLDFHCPNNNVNLKLVEDVMKNIDNNEGFILESGDSYHYYGLKLLSPDNMIKFLGTSLQYSPIIDKTWIAHQLRELKCALRVSKKHNIKPKLIKRLNKNIS